MQRGRTVFYSPGITNSWTEKVWAYLSILLNYTLYVRELEVVYTSVASGKERLRIPSVHFRRSLATVATSVYHQAPREK